MRQWEANHDYANNKAATETPAFAKPQTGDITVNVANADHRHAEQRKSEACAIEPPNAGCNVVFCMFLIAFSECFEVRVGGVDCQYQTRQA